MAAVTSTPLTAMPYENQRRNSTDKTDNVELGELEIKPAFGEADAVADYSGFTRKTDPLEIKLVRKLDMFIMVSRLVEGGNVVRTQPAYSPPSAHLEYVPSTQLIPALALEHVLAQLP